MKTAATIRALALLLLLGSACGPATRPVAETTAPPTSAASAAPTASPTAATSPSPGAVCGPSGHCLALVTLRGSDAIVVREVTDMNHPRTWTNTVAVAQFVNEGELSYTDATSLYGMDLSGSPKFVVAKADAGIVLGLFAWSPDGQRAAYMAADGLHVTTLGVDQALGQPLPAASGFGCESEQCADAWDGRLAFSPDGRTISLLVNVGPITGFHLWSSDGKILITTSAGPATMGVWSGRTFFFRDVNGVEAWRDGVETPFLRGVQWVRPKGSATGGQIVYEARDGAGLAHIFVVDTATQNVRELKAGRREPAFLTSRYVWYQGERMCTASDQCPTGPTIATGKTYIYDLQTGIEYDSIITSVYDVWPHAG